MKTLVPSQQAEAYLFSSSAGNFQLFPCFTANPISPSASLLCMVVRLIRRYLQASSSVSHFPLSRSFLVISASLITSIRRMPTDSVSSLRAFNTSKLSIFVLLLIKFTTSLIPTIHVRFIPLFTPSQSVRILILQVRAHSAILLLHSLTS